MISHAYLDSTLNSASGQVPRRLHAPSIASLVDARLAREDHETPEAIYGRQVFRTKRFMTICQVQGPLREDRKGSGK